MDDIPRCGTVMAYVLHWAVVVSKFIGGHLHLGAKFTCGPPRCEDVASG